MATPSSRLHPAQRARLRKLVRALAIGVIGVELVVIALATVPAHAAYWVCTIPCFVSDTAVRKNVRKTWQKLAFGTNPKLSQANRRLQSIQREQTGVHTIEKQHDRKLGHAWSSDLDAVTKTPSSELKGASFQDSNTRSMLKTLMPGAEPWGDYYAEYLASADTTLVTLRTSLDALYKHNEQIQTASALDRIARLASEVGDGGSSSRKGMMAMDELEIQSTLEVARQLHAYRAQKAIQTNIYAVSRIHTVGVDARSRAEDEQAACRTMASAMGGMAGGAIGALSC